MKYVEMHDAEEMAMQAGKMAGKAVRKALDLIKAGEKGFKAGLVRPKKPMMRVDVTEEGP